MTIQPAIITKVNDNKPGITLEQYSQLPLDSSVNPNVKLKDVYNPTQLDFLYYYDQASDEDLAAYDQKYFEQNQITFTQEMNHLLNSQKQLLQSPLPAPPIPAKIQNSDEWTKYISENSDDPSFTPTDDPEEIAEILGKRRFGVTQKHGKKLRDYAENKNLAEFGIDYTKGAPTSERFGAALLPREKSALDVDEMVQEEFLYDDLGYRIPKARHLYPGRPPGEKGPVIRYEQNADGTLSEVFPFNSPGVTADDWAEYVTKEIPAIAGETAALLFLKGRRVPGAGYVKTPWKKIKQFGVDATVMGAGAAFTDFTRLATGELLYRDDVDPRFFEHAFKESALIGAYATAGNAAAISLLNGSRATWQFITGKYPPDAIINRIIAVRDEYQSALKKAGFEEGSEGARALFNDIVNVQPKQVKEALDAVTDGNYKIFIGQGKTGTDADFALALLNSMREAGHTTIKAIDMLDNQILANDIYRTMFVQDLLLNAGNKEVAMESLASLGKHVSPTSQRLMQETLEKELAWFDDLVELGKADAALLKELGIDASTVKGFNDILDGIPGKVGDDLNFHAMMFEDIANPEAKIGTFNNKTLARIYLIQNRFMGDVDKKLTEVVTKYDGLQGPAVVPGSPLAKELKTTLTSPYKGTKTGVGAKTGSTPVDLLLKDKNLSDMLYKEGGEMKDLLAKMMGAERGTGLVGQYTPTFKDLHAFRVRISEIQGKVTGKTNEPSMKSLVDIKKAIDDQIHQLFRHGAKAHLEQLSPDELIKYFPNYKPTGGKFRPTSSQVTEYMEKTGYGKDYYDAIDNYAERVSIMNDTFFKRMLGQKDANPDALVNALFAGKTGSNFSHETATPFFKMLRHNHVGEGADEANAESLKLLLAAQRAIGARYKREVIEPFTVDGKLQYGKDLVKAHNKWMEKHGGVIRAAFNDVETKPYVNKPAGVGNFDNMTETFKTIEKAVGKADEISQKIMKEFSPFVDGDSDTIILKIVQGDELLNRSGGMQMRNKLAQIIKQDEYLYKNMQKAVMGDIYNQITDTSAGRIIINADKLNDVLTKNYIAMTKGGKETPITFDKLYEPFLDKKTIKNLKILNAAVQENQRMLDVGTEGVEGALKSLDIEKFDIPTIGRLIFGPLNPYTYRFGYRERVLERRVNRLLGEMMLDPKLLDKIARKMNRKMNLDDSIRFFYSLDTVAAHDVGQALKMFEGDSDTEFMSKDPSYNPYRTDEYFNYMEEFFTLDPNQRKRIVTNKGLLPPGVRTASETAIFTAPIAGGVAANEYIIQPTVDFFSGSETMDPD